MGVCVKALIVFYSIIFVSSRGACSRSSELWRGRDVRSPPGGNYHQKLPKQRIAGREHGFYTKAYDRVQGPLDPVLSRDQPQQQWQQQQHLTVSSSSRQQQYSRQHSFLHEIAVVTAFEGLSAQQFAYDTDLVPQASSSSSRRRRSSTGSGHHTIPRPAAATESLLSRLIQHVRSFASRRRSLLQLSSLRDMYSTLSGIGLSSTGLAAGLGSGDASHAAYYNTMMGQGSSDNTLLQSNGPGYSGLYESPEQQVALNNFAASTATAQHGALSATQDVHQITDTLQTQAKYDIQGLASQATAATPSAKASMVDGLGTVTNTVHPYVQNGKTGPVDVATRAATQGALAKGQFMHGTVVPMASGAVTAYKDVGKFVGNGFAEGYPEGYQAAMDRRAPYSDAYSQQQLYQQQPSLYLPNSFAPLGSMANITYPCPQGTYPTIAAVGVPATPSPIATAPIGTIVGPGIPCGVNIMMVPRSAVPINQAGPTVVVPTPTSPPVIVPPSPTTTPIPVNPLPPAAPPPPGGGTLPPNITPPNVRPTGPGGTTPTPAPVPITPVAPPAPTTTPATPGITAPGTPTPVSPTLPGGLSPPNVRPASLNSFMSYDAPQQQIQQPQWQQTQEGLLQQSAQRQQQQQQQQPQLSQRVDVSGPFASAAQAAMASQRRRGYSSGTRYYQSTNGIRSRDSSTMRQQMTPSLASIMGRRLRSLGWI